MMPPDSSLRAKSLAARALVWLGLAVGLAPFVWAFGFCFPRGDDFDEVTRAMFLFDLPGGLYEIGREWLTWSGRYTYHFLAVFLGKAGEIRWLCGLVCASTLALHGLAFYGLAREANVESRRALPLAFLATLALCASSLHLWTFYMLTEALTSGLQSAAALGFFWALCALWNRAGADAALVRRWRRRAILLGVLAVGVYEHAALAVLAGAGIAFLLAWFDDREAGTPFRQGRFGIFLNVALWCLAAALFSFFAPGNLHRKQVRGIDAETVRQQLEALPAEWLQALAGFAHSLLPLAALGLALLLILRASPAPALARRKALLTASLVAAAFVLGSLCLGILHALSDQPLSAAAKLPANLGLYGAFALGFAVFALLRAWPPLARAEGGPRARAAFLAGAALLALCIWGDNFQLALRHVVNGAMTLYAQAMTRQDEWLRHEASLAKNPGDHRFGLIGEILYPGNRARKLDPKAQWLLLCQWRQSVFPVFGGGDVAPPHAADWPNLWIAWMYGLDAVAGAPPDPAAALAALDRPLSAAASPDDGPLELALPPEAKALGLTRAWRVNAQGGPNPTFAANWLVLESQSPLPENLALLAPSPLAASRMAPLPAQAWLLERLLGEVKVRADALALWAAPMRTFSASRQLAGQDAADFRYAFPLGPAAPLGHEASAPKPGFWPPALFLRLDGEVFLRLVPIEHGFLDSKPESR